MQIEKGQYFVFVDIFELSYFQNCMWKINKSIVPNPAFLSCRR